MWCIIFDWPDDGQHDRCQHVALADSEKEAKRLRDTLMAEGAENLFIDHV